MSTPETATKRRFPWLACLGIAALLFILAGLLFPAVSGPGPGSGRRSQARNDVSQICAALKHYVIEYGSMPSGSQAQIMNTLRGENRLKIVFFEAPSNRFNARGEYLDPWGTPFHIDASNPNFPWAYSFGKDAKDDGAVPESDDIASWR